MPPLRRYTMGIIRRSLAFPPRARNKAMGGRAKGGGGQQEGTRGGAPSAPTCRCKAQGLRGWGGQPTKF